jgi:hypothetical protein
MVDGIYPTVCTTKYGKWEVLAGWYNDSDRACARTKIDQRLTLFWCASGRLTLSHSTTCGAWGAISPTDLIAPAMMRLTASGWAFINGGDDFEGGNYYDD